MICPYEKCRQEFVPKHPLQIYCCKKHCQYAARTRWISSHGGRRNIPALVRRDLSIGKRFSIVKINAKYRGYSVDLTREQYERLITNPCHWCGGSLPRTGGSLDRLDNEFGYSFDNCVPCCTQCNNAKGKLSPEEFVAWVARVYMHREERNE